MKTFLALLLVFPLYSHAQENELQNSLNRFRDNSQNFMQELPQKISPDGSRAKSKFGAQEIVSKRYLDAKDDFRSHFCAKSDSNCQKKPREHFLGFEEIIEDIRYFLEGETQIDDIQALDKMKTGKLTIKPWSDWYWPVARGLLGNRYSDPNFPGFDWLQGFQYISSSDIFVIEDKNILSPSEKYDFISGDQERTLTKQMWEEGKYYYDKYHSIESWMGICHGWAPASYMMDRPTHSVTVTAADKKTEVKFYPSDIKALATLLWANDRGRSLSVGGRCNDKDPKTDENGRIIDSTCFDVNPATWHLALVNRIANGKTFVFDAAYDYEVWNQPIVSYSFTYFNPETLKPASTVAAASTDLPFAGDKFKKYRSTKAKQVVGISMELKYLGETTPSASETDSPRNDNIRTVTYLYDLEINENGKVIGGEWYQNAHPDFMWTPPTGLQATSLGDTNFRGRWTGETPFPLTWKAAALKAAEGSQPLAAVVKTLIHAANAE